MGKFYYSVQGQGHSKGSLCQWMFVWMISSESQNILSPNLVWWCSIMSQSVMQERTKKFAVFKVKVTARANMIKILLFFSTFSKLLIFFLQPKLVWWYIIISQSVFGKKKGLLHSRSRSQWRVKKVNVCPNDIFYTAKHFVMKLGVVLHHHEPECMQEKFVGYFWGQGHSKDSYDQNRTVSTITSELLILLLPNLVW